MVMTKSGRIVPALWILFCWATTAWCQDSSPAFRVVGFYTARNDAAHISFVHEANQWFSQAAGQFNFHYDSTNNWENLNAAYLSRYHVVVFLDNRPGQPHQRAAFRAYMEQGGGWMGFHFAAFALTPSDYPQDWDWYHEEFLGAGSYASNTWRPTSAVLRIEARQHPAVSNLPATFTASPNEWYRWEHDLRKNQDITILTAIDSSSFPLGTGPKPHEIWHSGYYPVVWTNKRFKMIYINMGHNDIDYEGGTHRTLSHTFQNEIQNRMIADALRWLGGR